MNQAKAIRELRTLLTNRERALLLPTVDPVEQQWTWALKVNSKLMLHYTNQNDQEGLELTNQVGWALHRREQWSLDITKHFAAKQVWLHRSHEPEWVNSEAGKRFKAKAEEADQYQAELEAEAKRRGLIPA